MKKRLVASLMSLTMGMMLVTGCSSTSTTEGASSESTQAAASTATVEASSTTDTVEVVPTTSSDGSIQRILDAGVMKVGCKTDVPCFGLQNTSTGAYEGLEIDLAYAIAGEIFGVTPEEAKAQNLVSFQGVTAKTRGPLLESGELDLVIATFTITEERKTQWNFSTPYIEDALGLMCLTASGYQTMDDIDGAIIGVAQGSTTKEAITTYIEEEGLAIDVSYEEFDGYPALSVALSSGNIDIFSVDRAILAGYNDDSNMILPERFGVQQYGVASKLENVELATVVDKVVSTLLGSGEMSEMIKGWGIE